MPYVALSHLFGMTAVDEEGHYDAREERRITDAVPWLILVALVAIDGWRRAHAERPLHRRRFLVEAAVFGVLLVTALLMNAGGAVSAKTNEWNWTPVSVDSDPSRVWDWGGCSVESSEFRVQSSEFRV